MWQAPRQRPFCVKHINTKWFIPSQKSRPASPSPENHHQPSPFYHQPPESIKAQNSKKKSTKAAISEEEETKKNKNFGSAYLIGSALPPEGSALRRQTPAGSASPSTIHPTTGNPFIINHKKKKKKSKSQARFGHCEICAQLRRFDDLRVVTQTGDVGFLGFLQGEPFYVNVFNTKWPLTWSSPYQQ
ncbi:Uncharacterized protein Adt_17116 [Abeliophyllum distichum]|uniref:Uncharacterized protein n=1 Tax=Abeliophyllum distichum TaxID=126358 RepID=A0ABD1TFJ9_9LAMI